MNRLSDATSPYLLQHAANPVDWWPWSDEAFDEAKRRDVLVLLSIGYAACHWCHVMAHESFEDPGTAALLNDNMVAIKVDREERPDIDSVYMTATQLMTGQGGWPMTVVMTPDEEPVFCGTYLPRAQFQQLIANAAQAWRDQRDNVTGHARQVSAALAANADAAARAMRGVQQPPWTELTDFAVNRLTQEYDSANGGWGDAPKFPPSMLLEFLLREHERTGDQGALSLAAGTLEGMARGGIYDQIGGGFARYSVDATWTVPHFEKMLYDNALLARVYAHHWRVTGSALSGRVAEQTCDWMIRELRTPEGGLAASLDADSEGEEGRFYVWRPAELTAALGAEDGGYAASVFGVTAEGTFERGASVLQLRSDPADPERLARVRSELLAARSARVRPGRDDKVVAAWNGLAIAALAECGVLLRRPDFVDAALDAAALLAAVHLDDGQLTRTSRDGVSGGTDAALEDYACVADAFLVLSGVTGDDRWLRLAGELLSTALTSFADGKGGFYDAPIEADPLIFRPADPMDNASPSGTFAVASALISYAALTGSASHREAGEQALGVLAAITGKVPRAAGTGLAVVEALLSGPAEIAVVGPAGDPGTTELVWTALHAAPPGAVLATGSGSGSDGVPLLTGRGLIDGGPAAYVCRNFACQLPVTTGEELRKQLAR